MEAPILPPVSAGLFWCLVFDVGPPCGSLRKLTLRSRIGRVYYATPASLPRRWAVRGLHQGQQSVWAASTGRTHDCKRPLCCTPIYLLPGGGHPHMKTREFTVQFW